MLCCEFTVACFLFINTTKVASAPKVWVKWEFGSKASTKWWKVI